MVARIQTLAAAGLALTASLPAVACSPSESYDYIIVGGGTAGLAVASRLSIGLPDSKVLVIEAGPEGYDEETVYIPGMKALAIGGPLDWNLTTTPQEHVEDRVFGQSRGKVLGGSSAINLLSHDRAAAVEYDDWEAALGNEGWNWVTLLEAMLKAETFTGVNSEFYGSEGVGDSGPVQAVINRNMPPHQDYWIPTLKNLGIEENRESLGGDINGVMFQPSSIDPASWNRSYSANAYLPIAGANLDVWTDTRVAKVNVEQAESGSGDAKATGVTLVGGDVIEATREVIVAAGSLQSPQLLELSGIGKADVLSAAGVDLKVELPGVGENLQDHLRIQSSYQLTENRTSFDILRFDEEFAAEQLALYRAGEEGLYDYTGSAYVFTNWEQAAGAEADSKLVRLAEEAAAEDSSPAHQAKLKWMTDPDVPQLEVIFSDGYTGVKGYPAPDDELFGESFFTLICGIMHPMSRGSVHISSSNIEDDPVIDPNYLAHEHDVEALVQAIKYARKIAQTEPLVQSWVSEYEPGLDLVQTDEEWREFAYNTTLSIFHPIGTAAMLPKEDGGVVDTALKVYGTQNLRVIDASVMPVLISAHIATAVYGIAEMAADMIIADANKA